MIQSNQISLQLCESIFDLEKIKVFLARANTIC